MDGARKAFPTDLRPTPDCLWLSCQQTHSWPGCPGRGQLPEVSNALWRCGPEATVPSSHWPSWPAHLHGHLGVEPPSVPAQQQHLPKADVTTGSSAMPSPHTLGPSTRSQGLEAGTGLVAQHGAGLFLVCGPLCGAKLDRGFAEVTRRTTEGLGAVPGGYTMTGVPMVSTPLSGVWGDPGTEEGSREKEIPGVRPKGH